MYNRNVYNNRGISRHLPGAVGGYLGGSQQGLSGYRKLTPQTRGIGGLVLLAGGAWVLYKLLSR